MQRLHRRLPVRHKSLVILGCAAFALALSTVPAEAQRRHRGGGRVTVIRHSPLLWGGGFHTGFYRPLHFGFGQWYPYPHPVFGYPPGIYHGDGAVTLRLQVTPRDASVFVDGYPAGVVDDYDGIFQRLRLVPGPHEIVIYHPSHRTLRQNIYYNPGSSHTIRHTLDPLVPGDIAEPQPVPRAMPAYGGMPGQPGVPPAGDYGRAPEGGRTPEGRAGTLALRVPGDATVSSTASVQAATQIGRHSARRRMHRVRIEKQDFKRSPSKSSARGRNDQLQRQFCGVNG